VVLDAHSVESALGQSKSTCSSSCTVPVAFSADSMLVRNFVLLLPEQLDIQVLTREFESGESAQKMVKDILS